MKAKITSFAVIAFTLALLVQADAQSFLTNGLVAYYPFDGNANDASGNGNNGILGSGIGFGPDRFGIANNSLVFTNGVSGEMTTTVLQPVNNVFTISAWYNLPPGYTIPGETESVLRAIIGLTDTPSGSYSSLDKMLVVDWLGYGITNTTNNLTFYIYNGGIVYLSTPGSAADGHWHQAVATMSSAGMSLYLDGNLIATNANALSSEFAGYWRIFPAEGSVGDVRIYNLALSSNEVQGLYTYEAVTTCPPHAATGTASIASGVVLGVNLSDGGCGYTNTPVIVFQGGGGTGAAGTAVLSDGIVVGVAMTDLGSGYTNAPSVTFSSPLGVQLSLIKSVKPYFSNLIPTTNYQLQVSGDLKTWTNQGAAFTATNTSIVYPQYFDVSDWDQLFFRLEPAE